jgi:hypothetical protein
MLRLLVFARILIAKPVSTFAEYARGADRHGPRGKKEIP